jgi:hypothetical protein
MKRHIIEVGELDTFNPEVIIASSSAGRKMLKVVINISASNMRFLVIRKGETELDTPDSQTAIDKYNEL